MTESPITVLLTAELPESVLETLRATSPRVRLVTPAEFRARPEWLAEAEVIVGGVGRDRLREAPRLRWLQTTGAGVNGVVTPEVRERGLLITNASGIHAQPIAEHIFGFILMFARNLHRAARRQPEADWKGGNLRDGLRMLLGSTLGVLGVGAIGKRTAEFGAVFGMRVIGLKRNPEPIAGIERVFGPDELHPFLAEAEYVVNTLPLTPATRGLIGPAEFAAMRRDAFFVNIGRGATVQTDALVEALRSGQIAGAGLDVTDPEPLPSDHPLWQMENVILTPHYSGAHPGYFERAGEIVVENLRRYVAGEEMINVVDQEAGY